MFDWTYSYVTYFYLGHDSFLCVTWLIPTCDMTRQAESPHEHPTSRLNWLIPARHLSTWDMPHSFAWHDSSLCVTWLVSMWNMTRRAESPHKYPTSRLTWRISTHHVSMWDMTHSYVWHDSFLRVTWLDELSHPTNTPRHVGLDLFLRAMFLCGTWLIPMCESFLRVAWLDELS